MVSCWQDYAGDDETLYTASPVSHGVFCSNEVLNLNADKPPDLHDTRYSAIYLIKGPVATIIF